MIYAIIKFSQPFNPQVVKDICLEYNIVAMVMNLKENEWCLETEDAANFFWFGYDYQKKFSDWYRNNSMVVLDFKSKQFGSEKKRYAKRK